MHNAITQFRNNIVSVKELDKIYSLVSEKFPLLKVEISEILRAEIVLTVSAMDCFIHDLVRLGMLDTFKGNRVASKSFPKFNVSMKSLLRVIDANTPSEQQAYLESEIRRINSADSYQSPKSIEYALQLINIKSIWVLISPKMQKPAEDIKNELSLIINRRNKIAHEADYDSVNMSKFPIDQQTTNDIISFIEQFCESINQII